MAVNIPRPFKFFLERWIQKGILHQLLLMAGLVVLVAVIGGICAWAATSSFSNPAAGIWWAFLRLTDPGYLGDDEGAVLRVISTAVTVLGYVLFMGSLIAIMTQWLAQTIRKLESGLTPIAMKDHVAVLGWTNRTPEVVLKLLSARGRLTRFLARRDASKLRVVVLSEDVGAERRQELREHLGELWDDSLIFLRSGSSLHPEHLERLDLRRASVVLVPGADFELGGAELTDTRVVKTLLSIASLLRSHEGDERPHVVAEIFDPLKIAVARNTMDEKLDMIASDRVISRLVSQSVRHRGLAPILIGILSHRQGNSLYLRNFPELAGLQPGALSSAFPEAVVLGFVRKEGRTLITNLDPESPATLERDDSLVLFAESYDQCQPAGQPSQAPDTPAARPRIRGEAQREQRVLVLGWSHKLAALVVELDESSSGPFSITVMSRVGIDEREEWLSRVEYSQERVTIHHLRGDYSIESDLAKAKPHAFDHVLLLASAWMDSSEEADARTVLGYVLLRSLVKGKPGGPEILVELLDPDNSHLFDGSEDVVLVSPRLLSHLLAHVALRPELNSVFDALFGAGGSEIALHPAGALHLAGRSVTFAEIQGAARAHGMVALGVMPASGPRAGFHLNPARSVAWELEEADQLVVLARETNSG